MRLSLEWHPRTRGELLAGLADALETLTRIDEREIVSWNLPRDLYEYARRTGNFEYEPENGEERWLGAYYMIARKRADCEDVAAYLAAQRRLEGDRTARAFPMIAGVSPSGVMMVHILTVSRRGIEDPSVVLGMASYPRSIAIQPIMEGLKWSRSLS